MLFTTILLAEGGGGQHSGSRGQSFDQAILVTANEILHKLPAEFDLEAAQIRYPVTWSESMNTVLCQELTKFNSLTTLIKTSLSSVLRAVKGEVVMSGELEKLGDSLVIGQIPAMWKTRSYPSFKPLAGYINDLLVRLSFFGDWLAFKPPVVYWISSFFFTHAFLTASKQNFARRETISIDAIGLQFEMLRDSHQTKPPQSGVYSHGLFFEGARWSVLKERNIDTFLTLTQGLA